MLTPHHPTRNNQPTMYYTEQVIDGILHYKAHPRGEWRRVSATELTRRLMAAEKRIKKLEAYLDNAEQYI